MLTVEKVNQSNIRCRNKSKFGAQTKTTRLRVICDFFELTFAYNLKCEQLNYRYGRNQLTFNRRAGHGER